MFGPNHGAIAAALAAVVLIAQPAVAQSSAAQDQQILTAVVSVLAVDAKCNLLSPAERISAEQTHKRIVEKYGESATSTFMEQAEKGAAERDCNSLVNDPRLVSLVPVARIWEREMLALWSVVLLDRKANYRNVSGDLMNPVYSGGECGPFTFPQINRLAKRASAAGDEILAFATSDEAREMASQAMLAKSKNIIAECTAEPFNPDTPYMRLLAAQMAELDVADSAGE